MNIHREQQWQLHIQQLEATVRQQRDTVEALSQQVSHLRDRLHETAQQRDTARRWAVALEQEVSRNVCAICSGELVAVEVKGVAR